MPSDKDASNISSGSGSDDDQTATVTSVSTTTASIARSVNLSAPIELAGRNVQTYVNSQISTAPELPNRFGETSANSKNPSNIDEPSVSGFYWNGSGNVSGNLINSAPLTVEATLFPADRGVFTVFSVLNGPATPLLALNLDDIFVEGAPDASNPPSRSLGQTDYSAGSLPSASVDGLPQNIDLEHRLPRQDSYPSAPYDAYDETFVAHQLARMTIDIPVSAGEVGDIRAIHFKRRNDYDALFGGGATVSAETYKNSTDIVTDLFYDDDTSTSVSINSASVTLDNPNTPPSSTSLSGIEYYDEGEGFTTSWDVDGLFENSFLEKGVELQWADHTSDGKKGDKSVVEYDIAPLASPSTDPTTSPTASVSSQSETITGDVSRASTLSLYATDPFDRDDTFTAFSDTILYANSLNGFDTQSGKFREEGTRYEAATVPAPVDMDDLQPNTFNSGDALDSNELQIRGIEPSDFNSDIQDTDIDLEGGVLAWPDTDYSSASVFPNTTTNNSRDYSSLSHASFRFYYRSFDVQESRKEGDIELTFTNNGTSSCLDYFKFESGDPFDGHSQGLSISIGAGGVSGASWLNLGRDHTDSIGALKNVDVLEDGFKVRLTYQLDVFTEDNGSGQYPLAIRVIGYDGSPFTNNNFLLHRIEVVN
jgi:hypothetical protein